jgi:hypothetical protein
VTNNIKFKNECNTSEVVNIGSLALVANREREREFNFVRKMVLYGKEVFFMNYIFYF